jgi:hypothetical protein
VAEQLAVDGAFRDGSAVYGYVFGVLARAVLMYDFRKKLFAGTAFTRYVHTQVDGSHTHCACHSLHERRRGAHDAEALLCLQHVRFVYVGDKWQVYSVFRACLII